VDPSAQTKPLLVCVTATAAVSAASSFRPIQASSVIREKAVASSEESAKDAMVAPLASQPATASSRMTVSVER